MAKKILFILIAFFPKIGISQILPYQNLLDTSTWTVGDGSVSGFNQKGSTPENSREWGTNHIGEKVVLWKATPSGDANGDGGFDTNFISLNKFSASDSNEKTYRFSVWIKKTNSNSGTTYFGCGSGSGDILRFDDTVNNNPYFWSGDLPVLDKWYLLVGYVYGNSVQFSNQHEASGIYDGVTGERILGVTNFKLKNGATKLRLRTYLYYDPNTEDKQYFYDPRIEVVNGAEPSIIELLKINLNSTLIFNYDEAGNQIKRWYCSQCNLLQENFFPEESPFPDTMITEQTNDIKDNLDTSSLTTKENTCVIYPNPTNGRITINTTGENYYINSVHVYSTNGGLVVEKLGKNAQQLDVDLAQKAAGVYFVHIHFTNQTTKTEKIIKK